MTRAEFAMVSDMAFRNLFRHRVKTIITVTAVAVSVALYVFMDAWLAGMNLDSKRNIVNHEMGAVKIETAAYFAGKDEIPMYESFADWEGLARILEKKGYRSAPRFVFTGTLYSRSGTAPIVFNAVDTEREKSLLSYWKFIDAGEYIKNGTRGIVIGMMAADKLRLGIPQRIDREAFEEDLIASASARADADFIRSLYVPFRDSGEKKRAFSADESDEELDNRLVLSREATKDDMARLWKILAASGRMDVRVATTVDTKDAATGAIRHVNQLIDAVVVGVVNSPNPQTNGNVAYIPLDSLQDESGLMLGGRITELLVRSNSAKDSELPGKEDSPGAVEAALREGLAEEGKAFPGDLVVKGWIAFVEDYIAASAGDNVSTRIMAFFLFLLSFIGIANTMLMAILERTKEIGMLRSLGMTDGQLVFAYAIEASLVGVIGSTIGVVVGALANIPMIYVGIDYSAMSEALNGDYGYRVAAFFRSAWNVPTMIGTYLVATALAGFMAIPPTLHALKMPVTESLRFE